MPAAQRPPSSIAVAELHRFGVALALAALSMACGFAAVAVGVHGGAAMPAFVVYAVFGAGTGAACAVVQRRLGAAPKPVAVESLPEAELPAAVAVSAAPRDPAPATGPVAGAAVPAGEAVPA